jgi:hypothetical protein
MQPALGCISSERPIQFSNSQRTEIWERHCGPADRAYVRLPLSRRSCESRDHTPCPIVWPRSPRPSVQQTLVGPCFRRDDERGFNFQAPPLRGAKRRSNPSRRAKKEDGLLRCARDDVDIASRTATSLRRLSARGVDSSFRPKRAWDLHGANLATVDLSF